MLRTFDTARPGATLEWVVRSPSGGDPGFWTATDPQPWEAISSGATIGDVAVRVNHGAWIVDCPVPGCGGAQLALDADHRFVCVDCGAGPYTVVWPAERDDIETLLAPRPQPNRNWQPGETLEQLVAENEEHL